MAASRLIERAANGFMVGWLRALDGIVEARFGDVACTANPGIPDLDFMNTVRGLRREATASLDAILAFYASLGVRPWIETFDDLADVLQPLGFERVGALSGFLSGPLSAPAAVASDSGVSVEQVDHAALEMFSHAFARGCGIPESIARDHLRSWPDQPRWRLYLARVDGEPAAAAVLTVEDGVGYLANSATVPEYRRRGAQTALIARRLDDAWAAGCSVAAAVAKPASASARNLERAGVGAVASATIWRLAR